MDRFYEELALQIFQIYQREKENEKYLSRILDAKQTIKSGDIISAADISFIDNLLDDTLKLTAIINDNLNSFDKFMKMYSHGRL